MSGGSYNYLYQELRLAANVAEWDGRCLSAEGQQLRKMCVDIARSPTWCADITPDIAVHSAAFLALPLLSAKYVTKEHEDLAQAWEWACSGDRSYRAYADTAAKVLTGPPLNDDLSMHAWMEAEYEAAVAYKKAMENKP